jgi:hypothetical protein
MHVSNSHSEGSAKPPAPKRARDAYRWRSAQSARHVVEPAPSLPPTDSVDEADARLILEMRYQECMARRALEEIFESGEAEILSL